MHKIQVVCDSYAEIMKNYAKQPVSLNCTSSRCKCATLHFQNHNCQENEFCPVQCSHLYKFFFFPKQFTVGVLNAVLSVSALAGMLCPRLWSRLPLVSGLVSQLVPGLGCCVRLPSLVLLLSPNLSPIWAGVLRPPPWSRLSLVSGLVSQLVSGLGCCVRLPSLVLLLPPNLSPILAGVLRPPPWSRLSLVSGLVSQLVSGLGCRVRLLGLVLLLSPCLPFWLGRCVRLPGLVFLLSPVLSPGLGCCVRLLGLV